VHLFENSRRGGGLLTYGIPDFKMEKHHVVKRVSQMEARASCSITARMSASACRWNASPKDSTPWC